MNLSDNGSGIFSLFFSNSSLTLPNHSDEYNSGDDNQNQGQDREKVSTEMVKNEQKRPGNAKAEALQKREEDSGDEDGKKNIKIEGLYDPADYAALNVSTEITELFKYITRFFKIFVKVLLLL